MNNVLQIVCWKWDVGIHYKKRIKFSILHVNTLYKMLQRHLQIPFQLCCITDDADGIDSNIRIIPIWKEYLGKGCFVRLRIFAKEMKRLIGKRIASIDLDCVILDDITSIFDRKESFIIWGEKWRKNPYCGSLFMMDAGSREEVYTGFELNKYHLNRRGTYPFGTDQARIVDCLYPHESMWTSKDGLYNFSYDIKKGNEERYIEDGRRKRNQKIGNGVLPDNARMVFFNGKFDPSMSELYEEYSWIKENWK